MAVSAGTAYVDLAPRLQKTFSRDATAQMFGPATKAADKTGKRAGQQFGTSFTKGTRQGARPAVGVFRQLRGEMAGVFGGRVGAVLGGGIIAAGLYKTVQAASDLNETVNKARVVFGPASREVERFGSTAATSLGMSRQQAIEAAATLGNLFVSMKIGRPAAAQMSTSMVKLASDLASFNNADPTEVLEALRAGLTGETEPLRRFGINLNDAALRAEAMRLGLGKIGPTLTASQKAQASYSLILQQSKTAQGDFARTSDGLANRQRILNARWKDAQASLGTALLPVMVTAAGVAGDLLDGFNRLNDATGGLAAQGLLAAGGLIAVGVGVSKVAGYVQAARGAWVAYRAAALTTAAANALLTRQMILLGGATTTTGNAAATAGGKFAIFGRLSVAALGLFAAAAAAGAYQGKSLADATTKGIQVTGLFAEARAKVLRGLGFEAEATKQLTAEQQASNAATEAGKQAGDAYAQALEAIQGGQKDTSAKTEELTGKLKAAREEMAQQKQAITDAVGAYDGLISKSKVTASEVIKGIHNQVANFKTYAADSQRLIKAGVDPRAIRELAQKGPEYVHALATGSARQLADYKRTWDQRNREVKGGFATSLEKQVADLQTKITRMQRIINSLQGKTVPVGATARITLFQKTKAALNAMGIKGYGTKFLASGGRLPGYGGGDIVPIMGEPGEAMVPKESARKPEFRAWAQREGIPGFRSGGIIGGFRDPAVDYTRKLGQAASTLLAGVVGSRLSRVVNDWGAISGASAQAILRFIRYVDRLPYRWGGVGPNAYDCSGLVGEIWNRVTGHKSYVRRWTTAGGATSLKNMGFAPLKGSHVYLSGPRRGQFYYSADDGRPHAFMVGFEHHGTSSSGRVSGHTAGTFMGLNFEAANPRAGIRVGGAARSARSFPWTYYLPAADRKYGIGQAFDDGGFLQPGWNPPIYNGTGRPERVLPPGPVLDEGRLAHMIGQVVAREVVKQFHHYPPRAFLDPDKARVGLRDAQRRAGVPARERLR